MKTLKEFDYDLWAINDNGRKRFYVRIKETGEETEVSQDVMRYLMSQEKQMRRAYLKQQDEGELLSLNTLIYDMDISDSRWFADNTQTVETDIIFEEMAVDFADTLTPLQRSVFYECMLSGKKFVDYASEHDINPRYVAATVKLIRKKAKKFLGDICFFAKKCPLEV